MVKVTSAFEFGGAVGVHDKYLASLASDRVPSLFLKEAEPLSAAIAVSNTCDTRPLDINKTNCSVGPPELFDAWGEQRIWLSWIRCWVLAREVTY